MQKIIDSLEYEYKVIDDEVCINKIKGSTEHVNVPDYIDEVKVTELSSLVFQVDNLKSITLPKYFKKYDVKKTFSHSDYCDKLEAINISDTIYSNYLSVDGVLYFKGDDNKIGLVSYPNNKKESILYVPQNANWISDYAFNSCCNNLEKIVISSVLKYFNGNEFNALTNLTEFIVDELNNLIKSIDGVLFTKYPMKLNKYPAKKTEKTYKVPVGTESISFYAFFKQSFLEFISIPNTVKEIELYAFFKAESLKYVYLEKQSNLQKIGKNAFEGALQLQYINIPESVRQIDDNAFLTNPNCKVILGYNHDLIQNYLNTKAEMDCSDKSINDLIGKRMFKNAIICLTKIMEKGEFITTYLFKLIKVLNLDKNFAMAQDALFNFAIYITNKSKLLLNKNSEGSATDYEKQVYYKMILQLIDFEEVKEIAIKKDFHFGEVSLFLEEDLLFEYFLTDLIHNNETSGYNDVYYEIAMGDNGRKYIMDELREQFLTSRARIVYWEKLVDDSIKFKNTH